jgi:hypothetical protein
MADSIEQGLAMLVGGGAPPSQPAGSRGADATPGLSELDRVQEAVTGLGEALDELQDVLDDLRETVGGNP